MRTSLLVPLAVSALAVSDLAAQQAPPAAPLTTFSYDAARPLDPRFTDPRTVDGIEIRTLSFDSPKGGRATGVIYIPSGSGRHPAMLVGHGAPGSCTGYATMTMGLAMARRGAVTICLDAPFARRNETPLTFTPQDSIDQVQFIVDLRRGVDFLAARSDVDSARIGYVGNSFGGATGALFVGVEPRIKAAVLRVADGGWVSHFSDPCTADLVGPAAVTGCLTFLGPLAEVSAADRDRWLRAVLPLEAIRFIGGSKAKLLLQNGEQDPLVPPPQARRLMGAAPAGTVQEWSPSGHRLPNAALTSGLNFLNAHLGIAKSDAAFEEWLTKRTATPPSN
jgi:cephalosporin-C deacetylase-like acetyl esterase